MRSIHSKFLLCVLAALAVATYACGGDGQSPTNTIPAPTPTATPEAVGAAAPAAHRFVRVGEAIDVSGLGKVLEVASLGPGDAISYDEAESTVTCADGGVGFVRAQYRQPGGPEKNRVQTMAVVCVDEVGDCESGTPVALDLEQFVESGPRGEADYLASGAGDLYAVCEIDGRYRLQTAPDMPPLMLQLIDAVGNGPYTLGSADLELLDNSSIVNYSGDELSPAWIAVVGPEIEHLVIDPAGFVFMVEMSCSQYPGCLGGAPLVRPGDMLVINFGVDLPAAIDGVPHEVIRQFVASNIDFDWSATTHWSDPEARMIVVHRLVGMEIMKRLLVSFDTFYGLKSNGIRVGYMPYWQTRQRVTSRCSPESPEWSECEEAEALLDAHEREQLAAWQAEGYELWHFELLGHHPDGSYRSLMDSAPSFDAFEGVAASVELGAPLDNGDRESVLVAAVESLADEVGEMPVIVSANWGPMKFVVDGTPCEGEVCPSAFTGYYTLYERVIAAMLDSFAPGQVLGFGVALFDGGVHFDIRKPHEAYTGFSLNRVGETGFNSPLMNLYLAK